MWPNSIAWRDLGGEVEGRKADEGQIYEDTENHKDHRSPNPLGRTNSGRVWGRALAPLRVCLGVRHGRGVTSGLGKEKGKWGEHEEAFVLCRASPGEWQWGRERQTPESLIGGKGWCGSQGWEVKTPSFPAWTTGGCWCPALRWEAQKKSRFGEKMLYSVSEILGWRYHGGLEGRSQDRDLYLDKSLSLPTAWSLWASHQRQRAFGNDAQHPLLGEDDRQPPPDVNSAQSRRGHFRDLSFLEIRSLLFLFPLLGNTWSFLLLLLIITFQGNENLLEMTELIL